MMKLLIQFGGNPNATDTEKWTPLVRISHCAAFLPLHHAEGLVNPKVRAKNQRLLTLDTPSTSIQKTSN
jgi:hypothetical protein